MKEGCPHPGCTLARNHSEPHKGFMGGDCGCVVVPEDEDES